MRIDNAQYGRVALLAEEILRKTRKGKLDLDHVLQGLQNVIDGVPQRKPTVILETEPPYGGIDFHNGTGTFTWNADDIELVPIAHFGVGYKLADVMAVMPMDRAVHAGVMNALTKRGKLIPEAWKHDEQGKPRKIFFPGTIQPYSGPDKCLRYMYRNGPWWDTDAHAFRNRLSDSCYMVMLKEGANR